MATENMVDHNVITDNYNAPTEHMVILINPKKYIDSMSVIGKKIYYSKKNKSALPKIIKYSAGLEYIFKQCLIYISNHAILTTLKDIASIPIIGISINEIGRINVWCAGSCIPVINKRDNAWIPTIIASGLEHYKTTIDKGIIITNIFSTEFIIESRDQNNGKIFIQKFSNNMRQIDEPIISHTTLMDYIQITFVPDYKLFGFAGINDDILTMFEKNIWDMARERHLRIYYKSYHIDFSSK